MINRAFFNFFSNSSFYFVTKHVFVSPQFRVFFSLNDRRFFERLDVFSRKFVVCWFSLIVALNITLWFCWLWRFVPLRRRCAIFVRSGVQIFRGQLIWIFARNQVKFLGKVLLWLVFFVALLKLVKLACSTQKSIAFGSWGSSSSSRLFFRRLRLFVRLIWPIWKSGFLHRRNLERIIIWRHQLRLSRVFKRFHLGNFTLLARFWRLLVAAFRVWQLSVGSAQLCIRISWSIVGARCIDFAPIRIVSVVVESCCIGSHKGVTVSAMPSPSNRRKSLEILHLFPSLHEAFLFCHVVVIGLLIAHMLLKLGPSQRLVVSHPHIFFLVNWAELRTLLRRIITDHFHVRQGFLHCVTFSLKHLGFL